MTASLPADFYHILFQQSPIGLALCLLETGELVDVNEAYAELLGRSVEETLKLSYWQVTPKKYERHEHAQLEQLRATNRYGPYEKEYIHKNGSLIPVRLSGVIVEIHDKKYIWSMVESLLDEKYRKLFHAAKPALALCRMDDGALVAVNKAYADMIGYTVDEALDLSYWEITPISYKSQEDEQLRLLATNGEYGPYQKQYIHKSGRLFPVYLSGSRISIGNEQYIWSYVAEGMLEGAVMLEDDTTPTNPILERGTKKPFDEDLRRPIKE